MIDALFLPWLAATASAAVAPRPILRTCERWDKPGAECAMPPFKWEIDIYRDGGRGWRAIPDGSVMRDVWLMRGDGIPASMVPKVLTGGLERTNVNARLRLTVAPGGIVSGCRPRTDIELRKFDSGDPAVLAQACRIVLAHGKFRHALDADGKAVARDIAVTVSFRWDRFPIPSAPMPLPPAGFGKPNPGDWPPVERPYGRVNIVEPDWSAYLTDRRKLPKDAVTGLTLTILPGGQATECTVKSSSGDARLDAASCGALTAQAHRYAGRTKVEGYPLRVLWRKDRAALQWPVWGDAPDLRGEVRIPAGFESPAGNPQYRRVALVVGVDAAGTITACEVRSTSMDDGWDAASCAAARQLATVSPAKDVFGGAIAGGLNLMVDWDKKTIAVDGYRF